MDLHAAQRLAKPTPVAAKLSNLHKKGQPAVAFGAQT
jgi:hypothetical protein